MASLASELDLTRGDPIDLIEQIVAANEWPYDRQNKRELTVFLAGNWAEYHLHFSWNDPSSRERYGGLQVVCAFDARVPKGIQGSLLELLSLVNAHLWLGHFDVVPEEGLLMFRHGMLMAGSEELSAAQCEQMIDISVNECERFYPAFQFVLWGGKSPSEAMQISMLDTVGEA